MDLSVALGADPRGVPFRTELSLAPLVAFWTKAFGDDPSAKGTFARIVREEVERTPELCGAIADASVIQRHRKLVDVLMAAAFAPAFFDESFGAALVPFELRSFYGTPAFDRLLRGEDGRLRGRLNLDAASVRTIRLVYAYSLVLRQVYGIETPMEHTLILTVPDPDTGLERHFKVDFDGRFIDVETLGGPPPTLDAAQRRRLGHELLDPAELLALLPPERFVFRGFTIFRAIDVTDQEVLSSIKRDLIDRESIVSAVRFLSLQAKLQTFFRRPALCFGLAALEGDQVLLLNNTVQHEHACIFADSQHHSTAEFAGSIYERAVTSGKPLVVEDLLAWPGRGCIEDEIVENGVRSILVAPLFYQDAVIGTLELSSPRPGDLNATHLPKLDEILPLFSMAVQRSMEELNSRIQAFIKEKCTAIHPVVEWRFRRAVLRGIERGIKEDGGAPEIEPIVFDGVYPLYALSDIRGSSTQRALAIQADLLRQLRLARDVVDAAHRTRALPALDELRYRVDRHVTQIEDGLRSGDEVGVIAFLRGDVERLFDHLQAFGPAVRERVEACRAALDPRLGAVNDRRRLFEESVTRVADTISGYLDLEEQAAQTMFPHYFEKQKTDGVDHQIYVGASLVEDAHFDPLYLKNLRLWQLMVMCGAALRAHQLRDRLPVPLETTHLILVQHAPLAIRFRFDEKRFDVDGAYDIRYEIVKKRIDKALIKGTNERVTQPGRLAIVYAQPGEAHEYRGYIEYLQQLGYLAGAVEDVELEGLQGVQGLRALRVTVDLANPRLGPATAVLPQAAGLR